MAVTKDNRRFPFWLVPILFGIIFVVLGIWILLAPKDSYAFLTKLIGVILLVSGTTQLLFSFSNRDWIPGWGFSMMGGVIDVVIGVVLIMNPTLLLKVIALFVGIWLIISGFNLLVRATASRKSGSANWKWELGLGIFYLVLAGIFIWHPVVLGITIAIWSGLAFIVLGLFRISLTIRLHRHLKMKRQEENTIEV